MKFNFVLVRFVSFTKFVTVCCNLRFSMKISIVSINFFFFQGFLQHGFRHADKLVQFKFLWLTLCTLTQDLGRSMGLTYAVLTLHCFGVLVLASYGFLVSIRNEFSEITVSLAGAMMITLATLFIQCTVAQSASEEVSSHKRIKWCYLYQMWVVVCMYCKPKPTEAIKWRYSKFI
jgi:hypothetical protein